MKANYLIIIIALLVGCSQPKTELNRNELFVGASSASINPDVGMFIAGDKQNRRFTGIHDSIYAKAIVLNDGNSSLAIVTIDCIGLLYPDVQKIRAKGSALVTNIDLPKERIIVTSSHTHSGPDVVGIWGPSQGESGVDSAYMNRMITIAAKQIEKAAQSMNRAKAQYGVGEFGEEWVQNICEPDEVDRSVTTMQFIDDEGKNIASLTNFACHPTFLDAAHSLVSSDYVGAFYNSMSEQMSGEHVFLQGAIGGWVQPDKGDKSFAISTQRGEELASTVLNLLDKKNLLDSTNIKFRNIVFDLPITNPGFQQLSQLGIINREIGETTKSEIAWFKIGPAQFVTHPGETPPAFSFASKSWMNSEPKFVLGLGLDAVGYILKPEYFTDPDMPYAEYLTRMSPGPEAGPLVLNNVKKVILE